MLDDPHVGDRDPRSEDRQLLLDALLAATDRLIVTYTGNDERTNVARPPAVPVGELLDVVDRTVRADDGAPRPRASIQPPAAAVRPAQLHAPAARAAASPWSFDRVTLAGARALAGRRATPPPPFLAGAAAARSPAPLVELDDLVRFVERPVRAFLRQRLGISVGDYSDEIDDALPVELDGLELWGVGERLLERGSPGAELDAAVAAEIARGTLPPGRARPTRSLDAGAADRRGDRRARPRACSATPPRRLGRRAGRRCPTAAR